MGLFKRGGKWWSETYTEEAEGRKRQRFSTGVKADGTAESKRLAEENAKRKIAKLLTGEHRKVRAKLSDALEKVAKEKRVAGCAKATLESHDDRASYLVAYWGKDFDVSTLTEKHLAAYASDALNKRTIGGQYKGNRTISKTDARPIKHRTVQLELQLLCRAVRVACDKPAPKLPKFPKYKAKKRYVSADRQQADQWSEMERIYNALDAEWRDYVMMWRQTGMRRSELYLTKPEYCDFALRQLTVDGRKTEGAFRVVPMTDDVYACLKQRIKQPEMFPVWLNASRALKTIARSLEVPHISPTSFRKSFATEMLRKGVDSLIVRPMFGHKPGSNTLDLHYVDMDRGEHVAAAVEKLCQIRANKPKKGPRLVAVSSQK